MKVEIRKIKALAYTLAVTGILSHSFCFAQTLDHEGSGTSGGGDPKAIEFLNYSTEVCHWMATDSRLQGYSKNCSRNVSTIYESLGNLNSTTPAKLQFVQDHLQDANGVSKPAVTFPDGTIKVNSNAWLTMSISDRVRVVSMELSVLCSIGDRYNLGDLYGKVWDLENGDRSFSQIPIGTKLFAYSPITFPANTNAIGLFDKTDYASSFFREILTSKDTYTEIQTQSTSFTVSHGHLYNLGNVSQYGVLPTSPTYTKSHFGITNETGGIRIIDNNINSGFIILLPKTFPVDSKLTSLTIIGTDKPVCDRESLKAGHSAFVCYQSLSAVTENNPNSMIKIIGFELENENGSHLSFKSFADQFKNNFAIIFPEANEL